MVTLSRSHESALAPASSLAAPPRRLRALLDDDAVHEDFTARDEHLSLPPAAEAAPCHELRHALQRVRVE